MRGYQGRSRRRRDDRGTSALEFSIIAPVFLLLIFTIIQAGLYLYARNTAQSASREGVSYLRLAGNNSDPEAFRSAAENLTESYASKLGRLKDVDAYGTINLDTGRVSMIVVGNVVLPLGGDVEIQQTSTATLEQFRGDLRDGS
ncbi:TadE/TadG family type IV pilus assembly protein [Aeromicrobium sp. CTD01-1L150]|uniref:TadE/TadG family type IV pilus assembly protein n=1 Tax=Aeromicrobium sp. CTD01-1L150 TaxID=3341830 RepID=UPI0035BF5E75